MKLIPTIILFFIFKASLTYTFAQEFHVSFSAEAYNMPFAGTVVVYLSKTEKEPRNREQWTLLPVVFGMDIDHLEPGQWATISAGHQRSFPVSPNQIERGQYYAQVVFDRAETPTDRSVGKSAGNIVSRAIQITIGDNKEQKVHLTADKLIERNDFRSTAHFRGVHIRSKLLSDFYGEDTHMFGVVVLPDILLENPRLRLPLIVDIRGFGGGVRYYSGKDWSITDYPYISLMLDGNCRAGHHVFANSANNGPWGDALVTELIPEVERRFACTGQRFVTGHSSGGWAALWLQLQYPKLFDGCWSSSPDYVSFRHFQGVNIYSAKNFFVDDKGNLTPYALIGGWSPVMFNKYVSEYEEVVRGEQLRSFESVFGPRNERGGVAPLWDRTSGAINPNIADHWKKYDVLEFLQQNYSAIADDIKSKIFITSGKDDNFMLYEPLKLLEEEAKENNWQIKVKFVHGDHFTLDVNELRLEWEGVINERIRKFKPD